MSTTVLETSITGVTSTTFCHCLFNFFSWLASAASSPNVETAASSPTNDNNLKFFHFKLVKLFLQDFKTDSRPISFFFTKLFCARL